MSFGMAVRRRNLAPCVVRALSLCVCPLSGCVDQAVVAEGKGRCELPRLMSLEPSELDLAVFFTQRVIPESIPAAALAPPISMEYTASTTAELARARDALKDHLCRTYPVALLSKTLDTIVICNRLHGFGQSSAGLSIPPCLVFLNACDADTGHVMTAESLCSTFDHEYSSILLWHFYDVFPLAEWMTALPPGVGYQSEPRLRTDLDPWLTQPSERELDDGFVCRYARSSVEEDINCTAAIVLSSAVDARHWCMRFPRFATKVALLRRAYESIDPEFRPVFRALLDDP